MHWKKQNTKWSYTKTSIDKYIKLIKAELLQVKFYTFLPRSASYSPSRLLVLLADVVPALVFRVSYRC